MAAGFKSARADAVTDWNTAAVTVRPASGKGVAVSLRKSDLDKNRVKVALR
jgi:hypothetical protein